VQALVARGLKLEFARLVHLELVYGQARDAQGIWELPAELRRSLDFFVLVDIDSGRDNCPIEAGLGLVLELNTGDLIIVIEHFSGSLCDVAELDRAHVLGSQMF
jgi:hypothetical protein